MTTTKPFATISMTPRSTGKRRYWNTAEDVAATVYRSFLKGQSRWVEVHHEGRQLVTLSRCGARDIDDPEEQTRILGEIRTALTKAGAA